MPLETIDSTSMPEELNTDWPLTTDPMFESSTHLRNTKVCAKNLWDYYLETEEHVDSYLYGGTLLRAMNSDALDGEDYTYYTDPDNLEGVATSDQLPSGSLVESGVVLLSNDINDSELRAATPKALQTLKDNIANRDVSSEYLIWEEITTADGITAVLPDTLVAVIESTGAVEVQLTYTRTIDSVDETYTANPIITAEDLTTAITYAEDYTSDMDVLWTITLLTGTGNSTINMVQTAEVKATLKFAAWRKLKLGS